MIMALRNESPLSHKSLTLTHLTLVDPYWTWKSFLLKTLINSITKYISLYMSYLKELIEHRIMLVRCNKDIFRLSVGGSVSYWSILFFIHSIYSSDSHLSHSIHVSKKWEIQKSSVMGISKSRKSYKVYIFDSLHV